jgi:O-antigen/teichoic acid export membrane protein
MNFKYWIKLFTTFLIGQSSVQFLNLISGILLIRWLSLEHYAQYSVALSFQGTLSVLVDLGFSGTIIALVGDRISDKQVIGNYISSAKKYRSILFAVITPVFAIIFFLITLHQKWGFLTQVLLFLSILISLYFQGWSSFYAPPLQIHRRIKQYYFPQILCSAIRILLYIFFSFFSLLSSWTAAWIGAILIFINGYSFQKHSSSFVSEPKIANSKTNSEMLKYIMPLIPGIIFTAFQGQITILLITLFGQTQNIAEVSALGRLSQLFLILNSSNSLFIEPYIARISERILVSKFIQILLFASLFSIFLTFISFCFPELFLWLLGRNYAHLKTEIGWTILVASLNYVGGVIWTMNSARRWVYWWHTTLYIVLILLIQALCVVFLKIDNTMDAIYFSLASALVIVFVHLLGAVYGFLNGGRKLEIFDSL